MTAGKRAGPRRRRRALRCAARRGARLATIVVLVIVVAAAVAGCRRSASLVGKQAPEFSLSDLSGNAVRLANLKGRVVFLNVWATWCEPCREEIPAMESLYGRLHGPDFEMLAVNADQGDRAVVEQFVRQQGITFPVLPDPDLQIADRYGVTGYPETFIIDRNGRIVDHQLGPRDWDSIESHAAFRRLIERGEWSGF